MNSGVKRVTLALVLTCSACMLPAKLPLRADGRGPRTASMSPEQVGQTDFNRTVTIAMRDNLDSLYMLADKLYRLNPLPWRLAGASGPQDAVARIKQAIDARVPSKGLLNPQDIQVLSVALNPDYRGDRVGAFVYGLADTIIAAHYGKVTFYATDILDGQRVFNAARNVEAAAWMLSTRRSSLGVPLLLANEWSQDAVNLSFERTFGAIIGRLDLVANLLGENSRRIGTNYAQGPMFLNFLPVC